MISSTTASNCINPRKNSEFLIDGNYFEKGVKKVETNIEKQEVTITYDSKKNTVKGLQSGMKKIGYDTKVVSDKPVEKKTPYRRR